MSNMVVLVALATAFLISSSRACGIWGQVFCDYCWDGKFTSGTDKYVSNAQVVANCTVLKGNKMVYYWGSDYTNSNGNFETSFEGTSDKLSQRDAEASFLFAFFKNSKFRQGMLADVKVIGCNIRITNAPSSCPNLAIHGGDIITDGRSGDGWTSNVGIAQYQNTDLADIYIGGSKSRSDSVPLTPRVRGSGASRACPTASPPPPGLTGDPHFTGADGSRFDFTGRPGNVYCLLSDSHVHVNAYYGGRFDRWGDNPSKPLTWIRKLGVLWGEHKITLAAREGARWQYDEGYMASIVVDGKELSLSSEGESASFANGQIQISWLAAKLRSADDWVDVYSVKIGSAVILRITLRPEIALLRTEHDGVVHFDIEVPKADVSTNVHGVLGQTFRPDHRHRLTKQKLVYSELLHTEVIPGDDAEGFLDGSEKDYKSTGLLTADCKVSRFSGGVSRAETSESGLQLVSGTATSTIGVSRKMLKVA